MRVAQIVPADIALHPHPYTTVSSQFAAAPFERGSHAGLRWLSSLRDLEDALERHAVLPTFVRERPVASIAVAFGAGVMLATRGTRPRGLIARTAYRRLGGMVMAGVGALALAEVRGLLEAAHSAPEDA